MPWVAHSYNIALSDEIVHFEFCHAADANLNCTSVGINDAAGVDRTGHASHPRFGSNYTVLGNTERGRRLANDDR